jgi:hypothetical protein
LCIGRMSGIFLYQTTSQSCNMYGVRVDIPDQDTLMCGNRDRTYG